MLQTERLLLRPWEEADAESLYKYAKSPEVGPIAGWPVHTSVENSREIIKEVLSAPETYAVVLKETGEPIGSVGLMIGEASNLYLPENEAEIGYWIGVPYWGQGMIPEAVRELMRYGFEELDLKSLWCGYFDGNTKSRRVQEKCGFHYHHTTENVSCAIPDVRRTEHVTCITREEWREKQDISHKKVSAKMSVKISIRPIRHEEYPLLEDFLYEAIYLPEGAAPPPKEIIRQPELAVYIENFGQPDDLCLVAEFEGQILGAVWTRILAGEVKGYGNIDGRTPEFAISVKKDFRHQGIGSRLMKEMIGLLKERGYEKTSLSVDKQNYAYEMYRKCGFRVVQREGGGADEGEDYLMVLELK